MEFQESKWTIKRQLIYSAASVIMAPLLFVSLTVTDPVAWVTEKQELPFETVLYITLAELVKISCVLCLCPVKDDLTFNFHRRTFSKNFMKLGSIEIFETLWTIKEFVLSVGLCHFILILFGAPFIEDWKLTLQLSFILVSWLFLPLCLALSPSSILTELFYISIWDDQCYSLFVAKWRFLLTCVGTWTGAIVVPLDWDRPWQRWPIPCLYAAAAAHVIINTVFFLYLFSMKPKVKTRNY